LELILRRDDTPAPDALALFDTLVARRAAGEPAAYILGEREFFGLRFRVTPDVLIPRPETERIVEIVLNAFPHQCEVRFADFGTGSGALAVALAHSLPNARGAALDLSPAALSIARCNAETNGVSGRIACINADFTRFAFTPGCLDLVVANPPYVTEDEYAELSPEVRDHEPRLALVSPEAGLAHLRGLLPVARRALRAGGLLLCEIGCWQGSGALALASQPGSGFLGAQIEPDDAGLDRVLMAWRGCENALD
jgi:release factor glutamine methyltransferase